MLAGILEPDAGAINTVGRVTSLLELGAGFQSEYTGRENIYLYGALLGLRKRQIDSRFEQIVEFSELGSFIEYPVKNYSSGMYMRLGFAVAVHLDPEILLIDEVLAVGDAHFQQKCYDHLERLRADGKTIVLVSHDLDSVRRFCERAIWLDHGRLLADGPAGRSVDAYLQASARRPAEAAGERDVPGYGKVTGQLEISAVRLLGVDGRETRSLDATEPLTLEITYRAKQRILRPSITVDVFRNDGIHCTQVNSDADGVAPVLPEGEGVIQLRFRRIALSAGTYDISIGVIDATTRRMHDFHERQYPFTIRGGLALVSLEHDWTISPAVSTSPSLD